MLAWGGGGYFPSQGGGLNTSGHWNCLRVNCGHVFANTVRYISTGKFSRGSRKKARCFYSSVGSTTLLTHTFTHSPDVHASS